MTTNKFLVKLRLVSKDQINEKYLLCRFDFLSSLFQPFKAGQYLSFKVGEKGELRSYSIASSPANQSQVELMIDVTPHGLGTLFLQNLEIGGEVEALCPLGKFCLQPDQVNRPAILIGTGSGVAPLRSMSWQLLDQEKTTQPVLLLWGERFGKNLIWQEEFAQLSNQYPNFKLVPMISRLEEGEAYQSGRVTGYLQTMDLPNGANYYLCGNKEMILDAISILESRGVVATQIFHEKFY